MQERHILQKLRSLLQCALLCLPAIDGGSVSPPESWLEQDFFHKTDGGFSGAESSDQAETLPSNRQFFKQFDKLPPLHQHWDSLVAKIVKVQAPLRVQPERRPSYALPPLEEKTLAPSIAPTLPKAHARPTPFGYFVSKTNIRVGVFSFAFSTHTAPNLLKKHGFLADATH
jgi:hypothetical protein